jgi:predicted RNA-binding protein with PUA-like domain
MKSFWLVKQEPSDYSWSDFVTDGGTSWTGVRNFAARNNLRRMAKGDAVLFYHSGDPPSLRSRAATTRQVTRAVVGIARVEQTAYPDAIANEGDWSAVDLSPVKPLRRPVTLAEIKSKPQLRNIALVRQSRLSVMPLGEKEFQEILKMGGL